jgi:TolB protein
MSIACDINFLYVTEENSYMRKLIAVIVLIWIPTIPHTAWAILSMELTRGVVGAIPIAVMAFTEPSKQARSGQEVAEIITSDLQNSGRFKVREQRSPSSFSAHTGDSVHHFRHLGVNYIITGQIQKIDTEHYQVGFRLLEMLRSKVAGATILTKQFTVSYHELRRVAHRISDLVYQQIMGVRGVFSTKLVYVVVQRVSGAPTRYILELADQDGYNPRSLLNSLQPIMSPAWSPNGKQIAYVSFENRYASIYVQDIATGNRYLVSELPGINGAPAWSPDGKKLALVLSKSGSPNIYIMDLNSHRLTQLTHDWYINTEPVWSPDGKSLLFTSNRSGGPQVYQLNLATHGVFRLSYDGNYNARASLTSDGKHIALIHRVSGIYKIAILNLDAGTMNVLTSSMSDSASPSVAPNGSMVLYDTRQGGRNVLAMVSSDGSIQLYLPARNGEAQDPAWSPFLS